MSGMDLSLRQIAAALASEMAMPQSSPTCPSSAPGTSNAAPPTLPGLDLVRGYIKKLRFGVDEAGDWPRTSNRRRGKQFQLQPPEAAIDPRDDAAGIAAAVTLHRKFEQEAPNVALLFAAIAEALGGSTRQR